jgi:hypothetical protein
METKSNAAHVGTCMHLLPLLEEAMSFGARVTDIEQGYSEVRQVVRVNQPLRLPKEEGKVVLSEPMEYFESTDRHYHPVPEAGIVCRKCRQVIAWNKE